MFLIGLGSTSDGEQTRSSLPNLNAAPRGGALGSNWSLFGAMQEWKWNRCNADMKTFTINSQLSLNEVYLWTCDGSHLSSLTRCWRLNDLLIGLASWKCELLPRDGKYQLHSPQTHAHPFSTRFAVNSRSLRSAGALAAVAGWRQSKTLD